MSIGEEVREIVAIKQELTTKIVSEFKKAMADVVRNGIDVDEVGTEPMVGDMYKRNLCANIGLQRLCIPIKEVINGLREKNKRLDVCDDDIKNEVENKIREYLLEN